MFNKIGCLLGITVFIVVTLIILTTDVTAPQNQVTFSNQEVSVLNKNNAELKNSETNINFKDTKLSSQNISANDMNISTSNQNVTVSDISRFDNYDVNYNNKPLNYKNLDDSRLNNALNNKKNTVPQSYPELHSYQKVNTPVNRGKTGYRNIDWNTWHSEFINTITEGTFSIPELDTYPQGTMFHYSFMVDRNGRIYDIKVSSLKLSKADRDKVARLIKSYEYKDVTIFPKNSKRTTAKVSAILMLSDTTELAKPSDFHDLEQVKVNY